METTRLSIRDLRPWGALFDFGMGCVPSFSQQFFSTDSLSSSVSSGGTTSSCKG